MFNTEIASKLLADAVENIQKLGCEISLDGVTVVTDALRVIQRKQSLESLEKEINDFLSYQMGIPKEYRTGWKEPDKLRWIFAKGLLSCSKSEGRSLLDLIIEWATRNNIKLVTEPEIES